jgi:hypothetical protein
MDWRACLAERAPMRGRPDSAGDMPSLRRSKRFRRAAPRWSGPATWPDKKVPGKDTAVSYRNRLFQFEGCSRAGNCVLRRGNIILLKPQIGLIADCRTPYAESSANLERVVNVE